MSAIFLTWEQRKVEEIFSMAVTSHPMSFITFHFAHLQCTLEYDRCLGCGDATNLQTRGASYPSQCVQPHDKRYRSHVILANSQIQVHPCGAIWGSWPRIILERLENISIYGWIKSRMWVKCISIVATVLGDVEEYSDCGQIARDEINTELL
jgi:hypothetical protein